MRIPKRLLAVPSFVFFGFCLLLPVLRFSGRIGDGRFRTLFLLASAGYFLGAFAWAAGRRSKNGEA